MTTRLMVTPNTAICRVESDVKTLSRESNDPRHKVRMRCRKAPMQQRQGAGTAPTQRNDVTI